MSEMVSANIALIVNVWHPDALGYRSTLKVERIAISMEFVASWIAPTLLSLMSGSAAITGHHAES
jgi:hypothetical protein